MPLPPLGPIPTPASAAEDGTAPGPVAALPLMPAPTTPTAAPVVRPTALERRLSGAAFAIVSAPAMTPEAGIATVTSVDQTSAPQSVAGLSARLQAASPGSGPDSFSSLLTTDTAA